jgi:hypothetical protein
MPTEPDQNPPADDVSGQAQRVEILLAAVRDIISSLHRMGAQLDREVTRMLPRAAGSTATSALEMENAQLKQALEGRPVIEQAKGMLMARHGCDADEAFQLLVLASRRDQRKVREVASDVVASVVRQRTKQDGLGVSIIRHPAGSGRRSAEVAVPTPGTAHPGNTPPRKVTLPRDESVDVRPR